LEAVLYKDEQEPEPEVADFVRSVKPPRVTWDDDVPDPESSTYFDAEHGPDPVPSWVITADAARQYELGLLKTGKEAEVYLVERRLDARSNILAAKRYKAFEDRMFRNDARYRTGRRTGSSHTDKAMASGSRTGMILRARQWVETEFQVMSRLWEAGTAVPYPVQRLGREVMLEYLGDESGAAPRLVGVRASAEELADLYRQLVDLLDDLVRCGVVHGDLSPYNLLVWEGRLYAIDFPQAVDPITNPDGLSLLERAVRNTTEWFAKRGVKTDSGQLMGQLVARLYRT
jgi:RIO kinase 1